jgi:hypothetical protein
MRLDDLVHSERYLYWCSIRLPDSIRRYASRTAWVGAACWLANPIPRADGMRNASASNGKGARACGDTWDYWRGILTGKYTNHRSSKRLGMVQIDHATTLSMLSRKSPRLVVPGAGGNQLRQQQSVDLILPILGAYRYICAITHAWVELDQSKLRG